jgi:hypothetical protein
MYMNGKKTCPYKKVLPAESKTNATKNGDFAITIRLPYIYKK